MKDSLSNKFTIKVIYTDLNDYTSYTTSYYLDLEKNNFVKSKGYYDLEQKIEDRINLMISEFSTEMEKLVEEKLDLKISFYEDLVHDVMNSKSIILRIGRYQLPPCFPSSVSWSFDFTQVDEYGFPRGGSITFEGLQSPKCGERTDIGLLS